MIDHGQQRAAVVAEAMTWLDTPYHHHARIKGAGVDCAQLLIGVFAHAGVVPEFDPGPYACDWHLHRSEELFVQWLERAGARPVQTPAPGDVAIFKFGRCFSHGSIVVTPDQVLHAYINRRVIVSSLTDAELTGREVRFFSLWG